MPKMYCPAAVLAAFSSSGNEKHRLKTLWFLPTVVLSPLIHTLMWFVFKSKLSSFFDRIKFNLALTSTKHPNLFRVMAGSIFSRASLSLVNVCTVGMFSLVIFLKKT